MHESGQTAFRARDRSNSRRYSFEEKPSTLDPAGEKQFRAKPEETRARRLAVKPLSSARLRKG